jgi:hypothetical protein
MKRQRTLYVLALVLLCGSITFAAYTEGTDTTDVNGFGLDSNAHAEYTVG